MTTAAPAPAPRPQRSLFAEILDWMLTPLLMLWPVSLALTWLVAQNLANKPFDRSLVYNAQVLAQVVQNQPQLLTQHTLPQPISQLLQADDTDQVYYQLIDSQGQLQAGQADLPLAPPPLPPPNGLPEDALDNLPQLRDAEFQGTPVRVAWLWVSVDGGRGKALVQVAETREKRRVLAAEIIKGVMLPQFFILPLALLLVWLALVRGLKPLSRLEALIRARRSDDLSPLNAQDVPREVAPLVRSVNDLLNRQKDALATQKRFLADAAHQLKTPLAGLRMQADLARRESASTGELKQSLFQIGRASERATHTVNQLLALARAEAGDSALTLQSCDLAQITRDVVREAVPLALERGIDLGYEGPGPGAPPQPQQGNPTLLAEMLRNLVENAIFYTTGSARAAGMVTVRLRPATAGSGPCIEVEDNGPGIAPSEREAIFQPFYRTLGTGVDGSGLGLPIVRQIAARHHASVSVQDAQPGQQPPGARFVVRFAA